MTEKIKDYLKGDTNGFVKRNIFSSEFILIIIYIAIQVFNGTYFNIEEVANERIFNFVLLWVGARQVGKAVAQRTNNGD